MIYCEVNEGESTLDSTVLFVNLQKLRPALKFSFLFSWGARCFTGTTPLVQHRGYYWVSLCCAAEWDASVDHKVCWCSYNVHASTNKPSALESDPDCTRASHSANCVPVHWLCALHLVTWKSIIAHYQLDSLNECASEKSGGRKQEASRGA